MLDITDIFIERAEEWTKEGMDDRVEDAIERFDKWSLDLKEEETILLEEFLKRFKYYSIQRTRSIIKELSESACNKYKISNQDSLISVVRKVDGKGNSSHKYWLMHQEVSGLSSDIYYDSLGDIDEALWLNINKIVFVDDCSGTGTQFTKFLKRQEQIFIDRKQSKSLRGKTIILLVVHIIEDALVYIDKYAKKNGLDIKVEYYSSEKKAFCGKKEDVKKLFLMLSQGRSVKYSLGFQEAEALMAFYNNSPNDTLGVFWCDSDKNTALFPREDPPKAGWKMIGNEKKERSKQQYGTKR